MQVTRIKVLLILLRLLSCAFGNSEKLTKTSDVNQQIPSESEVNSQIEKNHQPTLALLVSVKPNDAQSGSADNIRSITLTSDELDGSKENRESMHDKLVKTLLDNGDVKNVNSLGQTSDEVMEKNHMENKHQELWDLLDALLKRKQELDKEVTKKDNYNSDSFEEQDYDSKINSHEYDEYDPPYRNLKSKRKVQEDDRRHDRDYSYDFYNFFQQNNYKNDKKYGLSDEDIISAEDSITDDKEYDSKEDYNEETNKRNSIKISKVMDNGLKRVYQLELQAKKRRLENNHGRDKDCDNESNAGLTSYEQTNYRNNYKRTSKETSCQDKIKSNKYKTTVEKKSKEKGKLKGSEKNIEGPYDKLIKKQPKPTNENLKQKRFVKRKRNNKIQNIENFSKENTLRLKNRRRPPLKYINSAERRTIYDISDCSEPILPKRFRDPKKTTDLRRLSKDISNDQNLKETTNKFTLKKNSYRKRPTNYENFESNTKPIRRKPRQHTPYIISEETSFEDLHDPISEYIDNFENHRRKRSYKRKDWDHHQVLDSSSIETEGNYDIDRVDWSEFDRYLNPYDNFDRKIAEIFRKYDRGTSSDVDTSFEYSEDRRKPKLIHVINEERRDRSPAKDDKNSSENDEATDDPNAIRLGTDLENILSDSKEIEGPTEDTATFDKDTSKNGKLIESPVYAKKGVRIPLKLVQDEDGNYNLQVDMKYLCKKCPKKPNRRKRGKKVESKST